MYREGIITSRQMTPCAAPSPFLRLLHELRTDRIHLDVSSTCQRIGFIKGTRRETALPKVAAPLLTKVDHPGISAVRLANRPPQSNGSFRDSHKMNVIRHQAVGPNLNTALRAVFGHQLKIGPIIVIFEEGALTTVPTLSHVVRNTGNDRPGESGHAMIVCLAQFQIKKCVLCPRISDFGFAGHSNMWDTILNSQASSGHVPIFSYAGSA